MQQILSIIPGTQLKRHFVKIFFAKFNLEDYLSRSTEPLHGKTIHLLSIQIDRSSKFYDKVHKWYDITGPLEASSLVQTDKRIYEIVFDEITIKQTWPMPHPQHTKKNPAPVMLVMDYLKPWVHSSLENTESTNRIKEVRRSNFGLGNKCYLNASIVNLARRVYCRASSVCLWLGNVGE